MSMVLQLERPSNVFVMKIKIGVYRVSLKFGFDQCLHFCIPFKQWNIPEDVLQQALNNVINRAAIH
ncbi:hypothetical protein TorRG33x02_040540 [Trema orientale]|uniref:Uncharacterized protein n=1 Tax=Trema orientale TaxID=63057 RepID=A0A2P5FR52_TREOI|nr:hypothetical protein TorRG33x02_040540 [Trema orientale]